MSWFESDELPSRLRVETGWPECADLDVRTLPDVRLPLRSTPVNCTCGECGTPTAEMAAGAARRPPRGGFVSTAHERARMTGAVVAHLSNLVAAVDEARAVLAALWSGHDRF